MENLKQVSALIVEDDPDTLFMISEILRVGVGIGSCNGRASGRQFFTFLDGHPELAVDLILLDIQLPYEDGFMVLEQIRQTPALRQTKVIACTANVMPQDIERARQAGFDGFIGKPLHPTRFPEQIRRILRGETVWEPY